MHVVVNSNELKSALSIAKSVSDRKGPSPLFSNTLVNAIDGGMLVCATDSVVSVTTEVRCDVKEAGGFAADAIDLNALANSLSGEQITIKTNQGAVTLSSEKSKLKVRCLDATDYPALPDYTQEAFSKVNARSLRDALNKVSISICKDPNRVQLGGVYLECTGDKFVIVSTDGHRLSKCETVQNTRKSKGVIVPKKGVQEALRILPKSEIAEVCVRPPMVYFSVGNSSEGESVNVVGTRIIESTFPPYNKIIPLGNDKSLRINRHKALEAFKRIGLIAGDDASACLHIEDGWMQVTTSNPGKGAAEETIPIVYSGDGLYVEVTPKYVEGYLSKMTGEDVNMSFSDNISPFLIHPVDDTSHLGVVMPRRPRL